MKYTCKICGYIYDEAKEAIPFAQLPDTWVCPLCGARKADFAPQEEAPQPAQPRLTVLPQDDDLQKLSLPEFAAVCSNLARGCEKQYKGEEAALFQQLAQAFLAIMPEAEQADFSHLQALVQQDLDETYGAVRATAADQKDRGALRICVWGEKSNPHSECFAATLCGGRRSISGKYGNLGLYRMWVCVCRRCPSRAVPGVQGAGMAV